MTNFDEFFKLLTAAYTKQDARVTPNEDNFLPFIANRYLSMYSPQMCIFVNATLNDYNLIQNLGDYDALYKTYVAVLPKLPYKRLEYIKRPVSKAQSENKVSEEDIKQLASLLEISTREIRIYLKNLEEFGVTI